MISFVRSDMRVDWCSAVDAAVPATARSAVGRTAVTSGPDDEMGNGLDEETGKEAEEFLTIVLPKLGGREVRGPSVRKEGILPPSAAARTSWAFAQPR